MARGLIIVDVQNDFCEGGSLAVAGGAALATEISAQARSGEYAAVVATRDVHIDPGEHFSDTPDFVHSWPVHCVAGTPGASFHPALDVARIEAVFDKGQFTAAYSGFQGAEPGRATLQNWLHHKKIDAVDVVGIATDYCVRATALDALGAGLATRLLPDLCAGVAPESSDRTLAELREAGVVLR